MSSHRHLLIIAWTLCASASVQGQNLLDNGGFELPGASPGAVQAVTSHGLPGWDLTGQDALLLLSGPAYPPGEGLQFAQLGSLDQSPRRVYQNVRTHPGADYELRFLFSPEPGVTDNQIEARWNGAVVATVSANGAALSTPSWQPTVVNVSATGQSTLLELLSQGPNDAEGDWVDGVSVRAITPRLAVSKDASTRRVEPGDVVTYSLEVRNLGQQTQGDNGGFEVEDVLPAELTLLSASATSGTIGLDLPGNRVTWDGSVPGGGTVILTIDAEVGANPVGTVISNQGSFNFDADGDGSNEAFSPTDDPAVAGDFDATDILVIRGAVAEVPTLSGLGALGLALLLVLAAWSRFNPHPARSARTRNQSGL